MITGEQHLQALDLANERRMASAAWRRGVAELSFIDGLTALADKLEKLDENVGSMKVERFLRAPRRMGTTKSLQIFRDAGLLPHRINDKVSSLSQVERERLAWAIRRWRG